MYKDYKSLRNFLISLGVILAVLIYANNYENTPKASNTEDEWLQYLRMLHLNSNRDGSEDNSMWESPSYNAMEHDRLLEFDKHVH